MATVCPKKHSNKIMSQTEKTSFGNRIQKFGLFMALISLSLTSAAQIETWWSEKHQWDGTSPFQYYMTTSAKFMGPNALPVPEIRTGTLEPCLYLENSFDVHYMKGDLTQNIFNRVYVPLFGGRFAIEGYVASLEHYKTDSVVRDSRAALGYSGEGWTGGDIYINTQLQIVKDHERIPDLMMTINIKTASGLDIENARYTDAPGYFFDLSTGKSKKLGRPETYFRYYAMAGFYSYQVYHRKHFQNDCLQYGAGINLNIRNLEIANQVGGYFGFLQNGDAPIVYRLKVNQTKPGFAFGIEFQQGLHDFQYSSIRLRIRYLIGEKSQEN